MDPIAVDVAVGDYASNDFVNDFGPVGSAPANPFLGFKFADNPALNGGFLNIPPDNNAAVVRCLIFVSFDHRIVLLFI